MATTAKPIRATVAGRQPCRTRRSAVLVAACLSWAVANARAETVTLLPSQDTPIYADDGVTTFPFGTNSNGAGETLYVGTNGTGSARRSLIQFDLEVLPPGSTVTAAKLTLFCDREPGSEYETLSLHTVTEAWTTGASNSDALGTPGQGAPAEPGDSTWYYRSWPGPEQPEGLKWSRPGAAFEAAVIASQQVGPLSVGGDRSSVYTWSGNKMVESVNQWLADPAGNFGWIMTGNETQTRSVKRFISSEGRVNNWLKPNLILDVDIPPGAPAVLSLVSSANPADYAQSFTLTANLLGGNAPTGTVAFEKDGQPIKNCEAVPVTSARARCQIPRMATGSYRIGAHYSGDSANGATSSKVMIQSVDEPQTGSDTATVTALTASATVVSAGDPIKFTASVRGGLGPAGSVTFLDGSRVLCNGVILVHRTASCTRSSLTRGKHRIVAIYSGDGTNLASSSTAVRVTVERAGQCSIGSKPVVETLPKQWFVHAREEIRITVNASDCLQRTPVFKVLKMPAAAVFEQAYDETDFKQTGSFSWTPDIADVERTGVLRLKAIVAAETGDRASAAQTVRISVLPPLVSEISDAEAEAAVARVSVAKAVWFERSRRLKIAGRIHWKPGTPRDLRANAIVRNVQLNDSDSGDAVVAVQAKLAGRWSVAMTLPEEVAPPAAVVAEFHGKTSPARKARTVRR